MTVVLCAEKKESQSSIVAVHAVTLTAVRTTVLLNTLSSANLNSGLVVCGGCTHSLLDLTCHGQESLLDIAGILGRSFEEGDTKAVRKLLQDKHINIMSYKPQIPEMYCAYGRFSPLQPYIRPPSYPTYHSCYQQVACLHLLWHTYQFPEATA